MSTTWFKINSTFHAQTVTGSTTHISICGNLRCSPMGGIIAPLSPLLVLKEMPPCPHPQPHLVPFTCPSCKTSHCLNAPYLSSLILKCTFFRMLQQ